MKKLSVTLTPQEFWQGLSYLIISILFLRYILDYGNMLLPRPLPEAALNFLFSLTNFLAVLYIGWRFLKDSLIMGLRKPFMLLRSSFIGLVVYYCLVYIFGLLTRAIYPDFVNVNDSSIISMNREHFTLMSISLVLLVPPVEEFFYRGLIFGQLHRRSPVLAYICSTVFFASIHVIGYTESYSWDLLALCFLQYIPAGICLAWSYAKADSILAPILIHITINQISMQTTR